MTESASSTPKHLWVVGILSTLWNAGGAFDYLATKLKLESYISNFSPAQLDYLQGLPAWFSVFWALGVWGALLGSVALLLRKRWAVGLFAVSLLGLIVTSVYSVFLSNGMEIMETSGAIFSAVIFVSLVLLLLYSRRMSERGVLR